MFSHFLRFSPTFGPRFSFKYVATLPLNGIHPGNHWTSSALDISSWFLWLHVVKWKTRWRISSKGNSSHKHTERRWPIGRWAHSSSVKLRLHFFPFVCCDHLWSALGINGVRHVSRFHSAQHYFQNNRPSLCLCLCHYVVYKLLDILFVFLRLSCLA